MATRRVSSAYLLVLLTSALFISVYSVGVPAPVRAQNWVGTVAFTSSSLLPNQGPPGSWVTFHGVLTPAPSPWSSFTCNLTASHPNFFSPRTGTAVAGPTVWTSCSVIGADVIGSFQVRDTTEVSTSYQLPGLNYTITLRVTANNATHALVASGAAGFRLIPKIGFSHSGAAPWYSSLIVFSTEIVYVHGWGFNATSTTCTYSALPGTFGAIAAAPACSISAGELTGQFTLTGGAGSTYSINATGNTGLPTINYGAGSLSIVSAGTAIQVTPVYGTPGMTVTVTGVGFSSFDTSCVLSYMNLTFGQLFATTSTCTLATVGTWKQPTVSFTVAETATPDANYTLRVMGFPTNDYAYAYFRVNATYPAIVLTPNTGYPGLLVSVTNTTRFNRGSAGICTITATPTTPALIASSICLIKPDGGLMASTSFYVSYAVTGGGYVVTVTGSKGDHASAVFVASTNRTVTLTPNSGSGGDTIGVGGVKFNLGDTTCTIGTLNATNPILSSSCSVSSGTVTGSFVIKTLDAPAGGYNITVTGNTGDVGYAWLTVNPRITLSPSPARVGANVTMSGSNFAAADANKKCTVSSIPSGAINYTSTSLTKAPTCAVDSHYVLTANSSFTVAANPTGSSYAITGNWSKLPPSLPTLSITPRTVLLSPDHGPRNSFVNVTGTGFSLLDTNCTITGSGVASPTCAISGGTITGSFQISSGASLGSFSLNVTGRHYGDYVAASFLVTPAVTLTPASGAPGTTVVVLGSGFAAGDTSCTISSSPSGLIASPVCAVAGGAMSGTFTVASGATGAYLVYVTGNTGDAGSAWFNRQVPTITLNPTSGPVGTTVTVAGSDFQGTTCLITSAPSGLFGSQQCTIITGTLSGSFIVASGAPVGSYTVLVQTNVGAGDSATGIFTVTITTTTTATTATTTTTGPGFDMTTSPSTMILMPGSTGTATVTVTSIGGFHDAVTLGLSSTPAGTTGAFTPNPVTPPAPGSTVSVLTIAVAQNAPGSVTVIQIMGTTSPGGPTDSVAFTLIIQGATTTTTATSATTTSATTTTRTRPCIIATTTFGSEVSWAVQLLRNFRDQLVLSTRAGSAFMEVFNAWYYSFSPSVAGFIANNDPIRAPARVLLYPLLGALGVSAFTYSLFSGAPEFAIVMAGLVASSLIGLVYLTLPALVGMRALLKRRRVRIAAVGKVSVALLAVALAALTAGELTGSLLLLAAASSAVVLICLVSAPAIAALAILRPNPE